MYKVLLKNIIYLPNYNTSLRYFQIMQTHFFQYQIKLNIHENSFQILNHRQKEKYEFKAFHYILISNQYDNPLENTKKTNNDHFSQYKS